MKFLFYNPSKPKKHKTPPFEVFYGTDAPSAGTGANGDYYFRHHNGSEAIYKRVNGAWSQLTGSGGGFSGWTSSNSQDFTQTSNFTELTITNFSLTDSQSLFVVEDGMIRFKGASRDFTVSEGKIVFNSQRSASAQAPVHIFVGAYDA